MKLLLSALTKFILGIVLLGMLLFIPAGSFKFTNAWIFMAILFVPMIFLGIILFLKAPKLLEKRLDAKEKENSQKTVLLFSCIFFIGGFILAGLDFRFGWSRVPKIIVIIASAVLVISYALYAEVMRENAYLSRTIKVEENQTVVDTGLYKIVRHPMYAVTIWLFLSIPLVLGSWVSFLCFIPFIPLFVIRIINEEKLLEKELKGYTEYKTQVKYRLIPFIW